jgi:hypothetical protein
MIHHTQIWLVLCYLFFHQDNVLLFNYKGPMRHIIGVRAMMINIAKGCFPEMKDLRLETTRRTDKFDA